MTTRPKAEAIPITTTPGARPFLNYNSFRLVIHVEKFMRSTITERGQTVIPAEIRRRFHLTPAQRLEWIVEGDAIRVVPVVEDPVAAFRGRGRGGGAARLVEERRAERDRE
jgi:AbrB family looped-hinge helix DNA binding protein